jgi:hypothetical protein
MKGIVFTEFLEMVEHMDGYELVDSLLLTSELPSGGVYTAAGIYDHQEMISLVVRLSQATQRSVPDILRQYGRYLFQTFVSTYTPFLEAAPDAFSFLSSVDNYIHVEVKKLYPEAELPTFTITQLNASTLRMIYQSSRKMADLAYGLIEGTLSHYGEVATITRQALNPDGSRVEFIITKVNG